MTSIELLNNKGVHYIGNSEALEKAEKTLIVVGVARGGTSLIAGTLYHLGIFTGDKSVPPVFEDVRLATVFETGDEDEAHRIIEAYNEDHEVWGFKRPAAIDYIDKLHEICRNPIYLFVFKDIFAIANRNRISMKLDLLEGLKKAHHDYEKTLNFITEKNVNGFLFSYEKIMENKKLFVDTMAGLAGEGCVSDEQKNAALHFIEPNPQPYLNASRITRSIGQIGGVEKNKVFGWGKYLYIDEPATVELYVNDNLVATTIAKDFRQNLLDKKVHPTGHCGYLFDLSKTPLKDGDKVSAKLKDDVLFLKGSDTTYSEDN